MKSKNNQLNTPTTEEQNNANQQHQDKQEEIQLKKEEVCRVTVEKKYETASVFA